MKRTAYLVYAVGVFIAGVMTLSSFGADETPLVWNGPAGGAWNAAGELNWLSGETSVAWTDGASASFGADTNVSLGGTVVVSNLTTEGALKLDGVVASTYEGFVPKNAPALVFPGITLADISGIWGEMGGASMSGGSRTFSAFGYHFFPKDGKATVQFQVYQGLIKCILVEFTDGEGGVYAKGIGTRYVNNSNVKTLGMDLVSANVASVVASGTGNVATSLSTPGYGVCQLKASVARVRFAGDAAFGGAVAASNVEACVTAPISQTWTQPVASVNGRIVAKGLSDATTETTYGLTGNQTGTASAWLTTTADNHVFTNMVLSRMTPVKATLKGNAIGISEQYTQSLPYHVKFNGESLTCQFQFLYGNYVKGVKVQFTQNGANVKARWVKSFYHTVEKGAVLGEDMENVKVDSTSTDFTGYTVKNMTLRYVSVPSLTLNAANSCMDMLVDNAQIVFAGADSQPTGDLVARNGANVIWLASCGNGTGRLRLFESGSTLVPLENLKTETMATYVFDDATLYTPMLHPTVKDGRSYFNYLTLRNGARAIGNPLRCGGVENGLSMIYTSEGTNANLLASGVNLVNGTRTPTNTLTFVTAADLTVSGKIYDFVQGSDVFIGAQLIKKGAATLTLSGTNTFIGRLTVQAGTLALASDGALPATAPLTLTNTCTVTCGGVTNSTGALTLSGNATLSLGDGAIAFADSSGEEWKAGATLTVTGDGPLPTQALRFGTTSAGLTGRQLKQITYNGEAVSLDAQGYLRHAGGLVIILL